MDDVEEERLPHVVLAGAPEDSDVRRSNVLCSKIIRDRSNRNVRFRRSALFMKIVNYNHPDIVQPSSTGEYPRPLKSPFPCYNCHRTFTCPPKFMPIVMLDGSRTEDGNYCSGPCMLAYAHANLVDSNLAGLVSDIYVYMQDVHGFRGSCIGLAPSFRQRQAYGGELTDDQFDAVVGNPCLTTHVRMKPFIPTEVVIEWQFAGDVSVATQPAHITDASDVNAASAVSGINGAQQNAVAILGTVMDTTVPEVDQHHRWEVRGLRQPPLEAIETRLASLPVLEKRKGLYEVYLERRGGFDDEDAATSSGGGGGGGCVTANGTSASTNATTTTSAQGSIGTSLDGTTAPGVGSGSASRPCIKARKRPASSVADATGRPDNNDGADAGTSNCSGGGGGGLSALLTSACVTNAPQTKRRIVRTSAGKANA